MKAIIIGASCSGKTTLIRNIRGKIKSPISEMDNELMALNDGEFPKNFKYKMKVLAPKAVKKVLSKKNIIFFTNTDYFTAKVLPKAKKEGFKIIQLKASLKEMKRRNAKRVRNEGYDNLSRYFKGMLEYQTKIKSLGLIDSTIDADQPPRKSASALLKLLKQS
jgi:tRNA uridine 5-carbamoylmethylation protein Kti12